MWYYLKIFFIGRFFLVEVENMFDIKFICENLEIVKRDLIKCGEIEKLKWIDEIFEFDKKWCENLKKIN